MIDSTELRIGNIISYKGQLKKVYGICFNAVRVNSDGTHKVNTEVELDACEYVALSNDILKKCGFVKTPTNFVDGIEFSREGFPFDLQYIEGKFYIDVYEWTVGPEISAYLHSLQNLYFVMTGKELEVNL